jgi:hypothetical protein
MSSLSYADIQRITVEAIKTMILEGRETYKARIFLSNLKLLKKLHLKPKLKIGILYNESRFSSFSLTQPQNANVVQ